MSPSQTNVRWLVLAMVLISSCGCSSAIRWPDFFHPGPAGYQRLGAVYHDPYPATDVAPEIVGGRPREYQVPLPKARDDKLYYSPPQPRAGYPWQ